MRPPAQSLQQYLDQILSQRGAHSVPYQDSVKWAVRDHLTELQKVFPSLAIKLSEFHANDGRLLHLLKADGTIPIHYQGNKYNIPVVIWLPERYPYDAPLPYVVPTPNMVIKAGHQLVDRNGQVSTSGVRSWTFPSSNLVDLALEMSRMFGTDPPLYSQPGAPGGGSASANGDARPQASSSAGSMPVAQPPPGYPGYPTASAAAAAAQQMYGAGGARPPSQAPPGSGPAAGYGPLPPAPGIAPPSFVSNASSASVPSPYGQPAQANDISSMAAANPLWGAAFSEYQRTNTSQNTSFTSNPPATPASTASQPSFTSGQSAQGGTRPAAYPGSSAAAAVALAFGGMQPPPPPPPPPQYGGNPYGSAYPSMGGQSGYSGPQQPAPQPPPPPPQPQPPQVRKEELEANFRSLAIAALKQQLVAASKSYQEHVKEETNSLLEQQTGLRQRRAQLEAAVSGLKQEREGTEGLVKEMASKTSQLHLWLERNEPKVAAIQAAQKSGGGIDWDRVVQPADELAKQLLESQAQDLAYEDTILALDKALAAGISSLTVDTYLRQVRALCRKQFFVRALGIKAAQQQAQAPMPMQVPGAAPGGLVSKPYPMAHGDSWVGTGAVVSSTQGGQRPPAPPNMLL